MINYKASEKSYWGSNQVHDEDEFKYIEETENDYSDLRFSSVTGYPASILVSLQLIDHHCTKLANDSEADNDKTRPLVT